jgi:hypothetical protein
VKGCDSEEVEYADRADLSGMDVEEVAEERREAVTINLALLFMSREADIAKPR